ncbi:unnamed protein product, partial [marine sediment metagenome]
PIFDLNFSMSDLIEFQIPDLELTSLPIARIRRCARGSPGVFGASRGVALQAAEAKT